MGIVYFIYYMLMAMSFVISIFAFRKDKYIWPIIVLLFVSICVEMYTEFLLSIHGNHFFLYNYFTPVEYSLLSLYIGINTRKLLSIILISIPLFIAFFYLYSDQNILNGFPALMNNIEAVLLIIWSALGLLLIKPETFGMLPLSKICFFWICVAVLIYFNGTFFFDGFYNKLKEVNKNAKQIYDIIHAIFNYIFYVFLAWGMLNLWKAQKYSKQSLQGR